jgi:hypothetical protein
VLEELGINLGEDAMTCDRCGAAVTVGRSSRRLDRWERQVLRSLPLDYAVCMDCLQHFALNEECCHGEETAGEIRKRREENTRLLHCADCGERTLDSFMVHDHLWREPRRGARLPLRGMLRAPPRAATRGRGPERTARAIDRSAW